MKQLLIVLVCLLPATAVVAQEETSEKLYYEDRNEIPEQYRWDLTPILPDREAWEAAAASIEPQIEKIRQYEGRIADSPATLEEALKVTFEASRTLEDVYVYANQLLNTNTADPEANELSGRAQALASQLQQAAAFIDAEISQLPEDTLTSYLADPELAEYSHYLDNVVRSRDHLLSPEIEEILAGSSLPGSAHQRAFSALENTGIEWPTFTDADGNEARAVPGQYIRFVSSDDRRVRRDASLAMFGAYSQFAGTFAATLGGDIQRDVWLARTRNYDSTLEMALDSVNVPREVVDRLVETVNDNLDEVHEYAALRKQLQGVDELHIYDLYANLIPGIDKKYTFEEGWDLAMEFWSETFGDEYAAVAQRARDERWIDVYTNDGKRPGAYSWGSYDSHPYLFLNWAGSLEAVSTLVHEMGHSIHSYLADQEQPYHDASYSLFVAEVASVASESLFLEWMLDRTTDPNERKLLLNQAMNNISGTFLRQVFFHQWEAGAHAMAEAGEPLTKESLGQSYTDLWQTYWGDDLVVDPEYAAGWSRISHFYRNFYVWVYATSYAAGEAIAERFRSGDLTAVDDFLAMLKLGGSVYPMQALQRAGVDMSDPEVIGSVMDRFGQLRDQMAAELAVTAN